VEVDLNFLLPNADKHRMKLTRGGDNYREGKYVEVGWGTREFADGLGLRI
jgi:hypothetical protein